MKTFVFMRACYPEKISTERLQIMKSLVIPAWQAQTDPDFTLFILCHKNTKGILEGLPWGELSVQFLEVESHEIEVIRNTPMFKTTIDQTDLLQIRVDNDDYPSPMFIHRYKEQVYLYADWNYLITAQPTKHILETGAKYLSQVKWYSAIRPANNVGIYQRHPRLSVYHDTHPNMGKYFKEGSFINEKNFYFLTINSENILNKK